MEDWTREDVAKWLVYAGLTEYKEQFAAVSGKVRSPRFRMRR